VLRRIDMSSILFFLGILLAVGGLGAAGLLTHLAAWLDDTLGSGRAGCSWTGDSAGAAPGWILLVALALALATRRGTRR
jgi:MYXO-CTERM domain-containing protein